MGLLTDILKEKIKQNSEKAQSDSIIDLYAAKATEGKDPDEMKSVIKQFEQAKKLNLKPDQITSVMKSLHPELVQDEMTQAIRANTLAIGDERKKLLEQQNAVITLPKDLTPLSKQATPEDKSAFLDKLTPELAANVQGVANYELDPSKISSMRTGERAALVSAVKMYDPNFDMKKYPVQQNYLKQLSSTQRGTVGGIVNSANTLIAHLDQLDQQIEKLKNTNIKPANAIVNLAKDLTGDPSITDYGQAQAVVNSEFENLLTGVGTTQEGLRAREQLLSKNAGYDQMKSSIRTLGHIMQARTHPLEQQYEQLFGKPAGDTIIHTDAKATLNRLYGNSSSTTKIIGNDTYQKGEDGKWYKQ